MLDRLPAETGPKFVWAHILLPHPNYVFDADGTYITPAMARRLGEKEAFRRQLAYTNRRLKTFLGGLLALPEEQRPIIILQSDEGYVFTRNASAENEEDGTFNWQKATPEQLEIKFAIMNAWYVPGGVDLGLDPRMTAINTFPILFKRYFGLDYELLEDRVWISLPWAQRNVLEDVTDRLPSLR